MECLARQRVPFALVPQMSGLPVYRVEHTRFFGRDTVMLTYRNNLTRPLPRFAKMVCDVSVAGAALVILAPALLLVAAAVKLEGGPVLFSHPRIGAGGRVFGCLKFRSMVTDSAAVLQRVLNTDPAAAAEWAATHKLRKDPRITRVGAFLRKTSLDDCRSC